MKYLVLGKKGQLGREFVKVLSQNSKVKLFSFARPELDVTDTKKVQALITKIKPDVVINCTAYNLVDLAETNFFDAYKTNALAVYNLFLICKEINAYFITYSTDYVFDGTKEGLYLEEDTPFPLNEYGKSKLTGEKWVLEHAKDYEKFLIFRTSWVYGEGTQNFIYKLINWAKTQEYLKIAYDEVSVPTSTKTIVEVTLKAIEKGLYGLFHLVNSGYASRYEWAKKIFSLKGIKKFIYPVSKEIFSLPAKRPSFSAMDNSKISKALSIEIPSWEEALKDFVENTTFL